jgi:uncharacterized membrane protein
MPHPPDEFRQQLLDLQSISPTLRESYQRELDTMLHPRASARSRSLGMVLLVLLTACAVLILRAAFVYHVGGALLGSYLVLITAFVWAGVLLVREMPHRTQSHRSASSISRILTLAAGIVTVIALIMGLGHASEPKALYGVFYVFVFYFACVAWSLDNRIKSAELSAREQSLRIECRLADLAERLQK